jgi:hypothetical protein
LQVPVVQLNRIELSAFRRQQLVPATFGNEVRAHFFVEVQRLGVLRSTRTLRRRDYHLLYADKKGCNLFHVRSDLIGGVDIALSAWVKTKWVAPGFGLPADPASGFIGGHSTDNTPYVRE